MSTIDILNGQEFRRVSRLWGGKFEMCASIKQLERDSEDTKNILKIFNKVTVYNMDSKEFFVLPMNISKMFSNKDIRTYKDNREGTVDSKMIEVSGRVSVAVSGDLMFIK